MIRHIIAAAVTLLALAAAYRVYQLDSEVHKVEEISRMIAKTQIKVQLDNTVQPVQQTPVVETMSKEEIEKAQEKKKRELDEKLQALKNKAGNMAAFKVRSDRL